MKTASLRDEATRLAGTGDGVLVDPEWLHAHLSDPRVRVVEVDVSPAAYNDWHIDGATLWNVYADLKDADYRLVDATALERLFKSSGIDRILFFGTPEFAVPTLAALVAAGRPPVRVVTQQIGRAHV